MIFCDRNNSSASSPTRLQRLLDADGKTRQAVADMDEQKCAAASQKLAWLSKHSGFDDVGMMAGTNFDAQGDSPGR